MELLLTLWEETGSHKSQCSLPMQGITVQLQQLYVGFVHIFTCGNLHVVINLAKVWLFERYDTCLSDDDCFSQG